MGRKPKFRPVITRVKLNPEQAVLSCNCYSMGYNYLTTQAGGIDNAYWGCAPVSGTRNVDVRYLYDPNSGCVTGADAVVTYASLDASS